MTVLLYGSNVANSSLTSAGNLALSSGGVESSSRSSFAGAGTYGELCALGGSPVATNAIPATPTGKGWTYAIGAGSFALGNWSASFAHSDITGTIPVDFTIRFFKYSAGLYSLIGSININATTSLSRTVFTFPATSMAAMSFDTPDFLYIDLWEHDTTGIVGNDDATVYLSNSATAGVANDLQIVTADFAAGGGSGILDPTVFGSNAADATIATACIMAPTTGGTETSLVTTYGTGSGNFGEIYAQGNANAPAVTAVPAAPTGHGWVYKPGVGTLLAGLWSASITLLAPNTGGVWTLRFFKYSAGTYTLIGSITSSINALTKTTYAFAGTSMPAVALGSSELVYIDLWYQDTAGAIGDNVTIYVSTSATQGVANDMQVTTANWLPVSNLNPNGRHPMWIMRPLVGPIFTPIRALPAWVERAITAPFIRPTTPVTIPHYVRRSLTSVLFNYTPATWLRTKVSTLASRVATLRMSVSTQVTRSTGLRTVVTAVVAVTKSAIVRVLVRSQKSISTGVRTPVRTQVTKSAALRVRAATQKTVSSGVRTVVRGITRLVSIRTRVRTQVSKSSQVRALVRTLTTRSSVLRTLVRTARSLSTGLRANIRTQVNRSSMLRAVIRGITRIVGLRVLVKTQRTPTVVLRTLIRSLKTVSTSLRTVVRTVVTKVSVLRTLVGTLHSLSTALRTRVRSLATRSAAVRTVVRTVHSLTLSLRTMVRTQVSKSSVLRTPIRTKRTLSSVVRVVTTFSGTLVNKSSVVRLVARTLHSLSVGMRTLVRSQVTRATTLRAIVRGMTRVASVRIVARGRSLLVGTRIPVRTVHALSSQMRAVVRSQASKTSVLRTRVSTLASRSSTMRLVLKGLTRLARVRVLVRSKTSRVAVVRLRVMILHVPTFIMRVNVRSTHTPVASIRVMVFVLPPVPNATLFVREGEADMQIRSGQVTFYVRSGEAAMKVREQ